MVRAGRYVAIRGTPQTGYHIFTLDDGAQEAKELPEVFPNYREARHAFSNLRLIAELVPAGVMKSILISRRKRRE